MNNHAVPTESEAIKHNMEDTHAVGFHFSLRYDYGVPAKSNLLRESACVHASKRVHVFAPGLLDTLLSWILVPLPVINSHPITPKVITELLRYVTHCM